MKNRRNAPALAMTVVFSVTAVMLAHAEETVGLPPPHGEVESAFPAQDHYSPYAGRNFPTRVFWVDTHLHTGMSMDEPYTTLKPLGSDNSRDLWQWMSEYQEKTGGQILAIPHNGNLSNGIMFPIVDTFSGEKFDRSYAETRAKWEPLYEVTQIKGDGEAHPFLSPNDEFADYETWDQGNRGPGEHA